MKNNTKERRSYNFEVRASENERGHIIEGRPVVYNSPTDLGDFIEIIESGALDKCDLKDVRFLVNHNLSMIPLARSRNNNENSTMQLTVDGNGLGIRVDLDTENNADARALYSAVERGDITGMSFLFVVDGEEWTEVQSDKPTRHIRSISTIIEVSAVTIPAYDATEINTRSLEALENARAALESVNKDSEARAAAELELLKLKYL